MDIAQCPNCGAYQSSARCEYCGTVLRDEPTYKRNPLGWNGYGYMVTIESPDNRYRFHCDSIEVFQDNYQALIGERVIRMTMKNDDVFEMEHY